MVAVQVEQMVSVLAGDGLVGEDIARLLIVRGAHQVVGELPTLAWSIEVQIVQSRGVAELVH